MRSRVDPSLATRSSIRHSFAFRLGVAFAVVAFVGAGATALVVNAAFAARFDHYLEQQQSAQLDRIGSTIARAYAGGGKWDGRVLAGLATTIGKGDVRVIGSNGHDVWRWDGHSTSWDDHWMEGNWNDRQTGTTEPSWTGGNDHTGGSGSPSGSSTPWNDGDDHTGSGWSDGSGTSWSDRSWTERHVGGADSRFVLLAVIAAAPSVTPSPSADLGQVERIPIVVDGKVVGTALVRLPKPTALPDALAFRSQVIRLLLLGGAIGALLSFCLGLLFARRATRPVREVTGAAQALAAGDRSVRLSADRPDEFGEMGRAFNSMADAVDDEERLRRSFAGEVAHELRTPLTILRTQVEGLRVGVIEPTPDALGSLDEEVQRMSRLVADLQILGSADAAGFSLQRTTVDLWDLVEDEVRKFSGLFEGSEVMLETQLEPATAWVDPMRVGQVLANLLSNALKFTPAGGRVRVELRDEGASALIRVSDSGPGIPEDELAHVFDRFFRGRTARASGSGIGLTVVRQLVRAQDGTVEVTSTPGQGATFSVRLPAPAARPDAGGRSSPSEPLSTVSP